jgi:preprotein translocase subunit YajC
MFLQTIAMATKPAGEGGEGGGGGLMGLMPIFFMVAIFYFIMIRPQRRREKERKAMVAAVKSGERILLTSGIIGEVFSVKEKTLIVRIADNAKIEVLKTAVSQIIEKGDTPDQVQA